MSKTYNNSITNKLINKICDGRLTLESGVAISTTDQTAKTVVYFTPYNGNTIGLYDGSEWDLFSFSELSLSLSGYAANTNYDIFIYNNSGTLTLESSAWTNDTTRATSLTAQDSIYVKTGAINRRYLGTIRTTSSTGQCEDSVTKRFVWNYYNREERLLRKYIYGSWTYATAAWRVFAGASASTYSVDVVTGLSQDSIFLKAGLLYTIAVTTSTIYYIAVAQDSSINIIDIGNTNNAVERVQSVSANQTQLVSELDHIVPLGYHYYYPVEYRETGGTPTLFAIDTTLWGGLLGTWRC